MLAVASELSEEKQPIVVVKVLPASAGDCILVNIADQLILIDGGFVNTFNDYLKDELTVHKGQGIDYLIITHIDRDHISGINKLLSLNQNNALIPIRHIWHNAYRHIQGIGVDLDKYKSLEGKTISDIPQLSYLKEEGIQDKDVSAEQGSTLAGMILGGGYLWNEAFRGHAVCTNNGREIALSDQVKLTLLSPDNDKLTELEKYWYKKLYAKGYKLESKDSSFYDDAFEFLLAANKAQKKVVNKNVSGSIDLEELAQAEFDDDTEEPNGSSIAFILETEGFTGLFLGDAHPGIIAANIREYYKGQAFPVRFDLIKVAHHGVIFNNSRDLLDVIDAERYVFSTNGAGYDHPDPETLARIIVRPAGFIRTLYFNYPVKTATEINLPDLKAKYRYEIVMGDGKSILEPYKRQDAR